jgi:predicted PurR-regulated permease PerM
MVDDVNDSVGWTRARVVFLSIAGGLTVLLLILVREVLLPFMLAAIIAYVLAPLVAWGEKRARLPRPLAIVLVYAVVLGTVGLLVSALAPVLWRESIGLVRDAPAMVRRAAATYGPEVDVRVNAFLGHLPIEDKVEHVVRPSERRPALVIEPTQDGAYAVHLGDGVEVLEESPGHYRLWDQGNLPVGRFELAAALDDAFDRLVKYVETNAGGVLKLGQRIVEGTTRAVFVLFMVLMVAAYLMYTRESILGFFRSLVPPLHRSSFDRLALRMDRGLAGVVRGQLLICLVNGVLSAIGFWLFGLKYWPVLALVATVLSIIPIFGAILSTVPAILVGLTQSFGIALWVLLWIVGIHQLEANLLNPKIIGDSAKIHPALIVFSLLVGEHFFGIWGALLAVPILSIVQSIFNHFRFGLADAPPDSLRLVAERLRSD